MIYYFSLTTNKHQPSLSAQKPTIALAARCAHYFSSGRCTCVQEDELPTIYGVFPCMSLNSFWFPSHSIVSWAKGIKNERVLSLTPRLTSPVVPTLQACMHLRPWEWDCGSLHASVLAMLNIHSYTKQKITVEPSLPDIYTLVDSRSKSNKT